MKSGDIRDFEWLLDYELKQSSRHRRFVSLVMISANGSSDKLNKILEGMVRSSDPLFCLTKSVAVLMGETDSAGALRAVERYQEMISDAVDVRYAMASFPDDGKAPDELMHTASRRLDMAASSDSTLVVAEG